ALDLLRAPVAELAARAGLEPQPGRMVIELRPPGGDKGVALTRLRAERGSVAVMYCGDDLGGIPAFAAVAGARGRRGPGRDWCSGSEGVSGVAAVADRVVKAPDGVASLLDAHATAMNVAHGSP